MANQTIYPYGTNGQLPSSIGIINDLTTGGADKALSAKMGKVLKDNIEVLNGNINALNEALANIAFKSLPKPTMSELDFGGDKYAVTLNNTLSGCTSNKSGVQQVTEGSNLVITITADNGKLLRSVTASSGSVVISSSKESATITIANVMADATITINASATAKGSFTASISDSRVSGTGAASGIVEGSAWSSQLSLNNTAEEGAAITSISASMAGGGTISVNGNTISTSFVTGNITITAVVRVVGSFIVTLPSNSKLNFSNEARSVPEGSSYSNTLSLNNTAAAGETINNLTATMEGGGTISVNGNTISTQNVTGNIVISCSVGVEPSKVHSWGYESVYDADNKRYLPDAKGDFWLYNQSDAGLNSQYVPGGCYGNADSSVTNANAGYGSHRTLYGGNNFTIRVKHFEIVQRTDSSAGVNAYLAQQKSVKMFSAGSLQYTPGQFRLKLTSSNGSGTTSSSFCIGIDYGYNSSSESVYFNQQMTAVSDNNIHDYFITYDSTTNKVSCYRATIDPNGVSATTVVKCGEAEPQTALKFRLVAYKPEESNINGVDIYNYAMTQADVEQEYGITNLNE